MRGPTSGFLDRVHRDALIDDRSRLAGEVRAVFFALLASMDPEEADRWARRLPSDLESLWKPAYFEVLRSRDEAGRGAGAPAPGADTPGTDARAARPVEVLRRRLPEERRAEAEQLTRAVLRALREQLSPSDREAMGRRLPGELSRLIA